MQLPTWTKPALWGAGAGAITLAFVGFTWGGWVTGASAEDLATEMTETAVAEVLTPYCVRSSKTDPKAKEIFVQYEEASAYQRRQIIEKAGWATPLGAEEPNRELVKTCQIEISKDM
ncbi:hypothetical protein [Maritalea myrionectae]|uniref:Uncharacterized protein n=1 Tax=Maritalea myrionectae TaxID=454601 RepID=A0A2R4MH81_9HYPH|nr:hypothetical protein [Maritalea myrionectae]AVX05239.1 hypothetical protein MXMO3_02728 [Maritalea myrionectae]